MEAITKLYSYYITNAAIELKYMFNNIPDNQYEKQVKETIHILQYEEDNKLEENELIDSDNIFSDDNGEEIVITSTSFDENLNDFNNYFDFSNDEFRHALEMDVSVVIEPYTSEIEHGELEFDSDELLNTMLMQ